MLTSVYLKKMNCFLHNSNWFYWNLSWPMKKKYCPIKNLSSLFQQFLNFQPFFFAFGLDSSNYWFFFQENTISSCAKERRMHFYHGWYYEFHLVIFKAKVALKLWGQSRFENSKTKVLHCGFLICEFYSYWQKYWNANQYLPLEAEHMIAISGHWLWPSAGVASCFRSEGQWNGTSF